MALDGEATVLVAASADLIWSLISDITRMGQWSPETTGARWIAPAAGPGVGARFEGTNKRRSTWKTTAEVTVARPGHEFSFTVGRRKPALWSYQLEPVPDGTRVRESFHVPWYGPLDRLMFRLTTGVKDRQADLVNGCHVTLSRLKTAAEQAATQQGEHA